MGIFESIFKKKNENVPSRTYFKMLNGYTPIFTSVPESVYEMEITRAAIHSFASHCSKLKPEMIGSAKNHLKYVLENKPNEFTDITKFLYRTATILAVHNTAFIIPIEDEKGMIKGYYPIVPDYCEVVEYQKRPYLVYNFSNGQRASIEFEKVGILNQYQLKDDFFGDQTNVLKPTMELIHAQNEGIVNGVKNSAYIRFMGKLTNVFDEETIKESRDNFTRLNLTSENTSQLILSDSTMDLTPIESKPFTINAAQMQAINNNVFNYYGTNEKILQNKFNEDEWAAYYEGKIEPFAIQLSVVMTNMTYSQREISLNNGIFFSSNRLQYASNATKLAVSTQLMDRGIFNINKILEIWNMPRVPHGDKYYIRKEYTEVTNLDANLKGDELNANKTNPAIPPNDNTLSNSNTE